MVHHDVCVVVHIGESATGSATATGREYRPDSRCDSVGRHRHIALRDPGCLDATPVARRLRRPVQLAIRCPPALSFRINQTLLTLIGGTAAVAIGFALKDLVASFVAGITILLDQPFQVGDRVEFGGYYGDVTAIGLRSVRLQTLNDNTVTIPNSKFLSDITSSGNYGALDMMVLMDFHVAIDQDIDLARCIVSEAALSSRYIFLDKPVVVQVNQLLMENLISVRLRLKAYVLDTRHEGAFETDVNLRCLRAFREAGIEAPSLLPAANLGQR